MCGVFIKMFPDENCRFPHPPLSRLLLLPQGAESALALPQRKCISKGERRLDFYDLSKWVFRVPNAKVFREYCNWFSFWMKSQAQLAIFPGKFQHVLYKSVSNSKERPLDLNSKLESQDCFLVLHEPLMVDLDE